MSTAAASETSPSQRREALLDRAVDHVMSTGFAGLSVRTLATALGVAHNTVTYHFGSRDALLEAIMERLSLRAQQESGAGFVTEQDHTHDGSSEVRQRLHSTWSWLSDPTQRPMWVTFFEAFAIAVREPARYERFLSRLGAGWIDPLIAEFMATGVSRETAEARATMMVSTVRGLMLHGLASGGGETDARVEAGFAALAEVVTLWTRHPDDEK